MDCEPFYLDFVLSLADTQSGDMVPILSQSGYLIALLAGHPPGKSWSERMGRSWIMHVRTCCS